MGIGERSLPSRYLSSKALKSCKVAAVAGAGGAGGMKGLRSDQMELPGSLLGLLLLLLVIWESLRGFEWESD